MSTGAMLELQRWRRGRRLDPAAASPLFQQTGGAVQLIVGTLSTIAKPALGDHRPLRGAMLETDDNEMA
jgi:hypothetical protein